MLKKTFLSVAIIFCFISSVIAAELIPIKLLPPDLKGGKSLMQSLQERQTSRSFSTKKLSLEVLSNLMWAACGINRPDGKRTAPTAVNWQEIDVYVARADGLWLFDPKTNDMKLILPKDLRAETGKQEFVKGAPVNLVFVADFARMGKAAEADKMVRQAWITLGSSAATEQLVKKALG